MGKILSVSYIIELRVLTYFEIIYNLQNTIKQIHLGNTMQQIMLFLVLLINLDKTNFCVVFVDLEKAFDTVNHRIRLTKFAYYEIRGKANMNEYTQIVLKR